MAQSRHAPVIKSFNQTTLGLAVKLYYQFGSNEPIEVLHSSGYICFSTMKFTVSENLSPKLQPRTKISIKTCSKLIIYFRVWFDNLNLRVYSPNGVRESHCIAVEVTYNSQSSNIHTLCTLFSDRYSLLQHIIVHLSIAILSNNKFS